MNFDFIKRFRDARNNRRERRSREVSQELRNLFYSNPIMSDYENMFAQVRPLIDALKVVMPYGVDEKGEKLNEDKTPELNVLKNPNYDTGWSEFADLMFASWLTEDELDVHAWKNDRGDIIGYTVLPPNSKTSLGNGQYQWRVYNNENKAIILGEDDVLRLRFSRSPKNPEQGVSPASSIKIWAQIDDLIGQYQKAYFENGAVPATITFISASTKAKYDEVRRELESNLKGAKNKNKTVYVWRQFDNDTGESADQVEIKTIQGNNSTLALKDIVSIVNDKLNKSVGVSEFILGNDASAKYDNAELSDYQFTRRRVYPALVSFWNQFQSELDRITGGLGYAIGFDLDIPDLTERQKAKAEVAKVKSETLVGLISAGASGFSAVKALDLDEKWQRVADDIYTKKLLEKDENEVRLLAGAEPEKKTVDVKHNHEHTLDKLPPMNKQEKAVYDRLINVAQYLIKEQNVVVADVVDEMSKLLTQYAKEGAIDGAKAVAMLADTDIKGEILKTVSNGDIYTSKELEKRIYNRAEALTAGYVDDTKKAIKEVLSTSKSLTANERSDLLQNVVPYTKAELIARNETNYAVRSGVLEQDKALAEKYGLTMNLVWRTSGDADVCDVCAGMEGEKTVLGQAFSDTAEYNGENVSWTPSEWNDHGQIPNAHPNCRCYYDVEIV